MSNKDANERTLKADRDVVLAAVQQTVHAWQFASENLREDRSVVLAALSGRAEGRDDVSEVLRFCPVELYSDRAIALAAVGVDGSMLNVFDELHADREVVLAAVARHGSALLYATNELRSDEEVVRVALASDGAALRYVDDQLLQNLDRGLVLDALASCRTTYVGDGDGIGVIQLKPGGVAPLRKNPFMVPGFGDTGYGGNTGFWHHAIYNGYPPRLPGWVFGDREAVLTAVGACGLALEFVPEPLRRDPEVVRAAVAQEGLALQFTPTALRADPEIVRIAVRSRPQAIVFACLELPTLEEFHEIALRGLRALDPELQEHWRTANLVVRRGGGGVLVQAMDRAAAYTVFSFLVKDLGWYTLAAPDLRWQRHRMQQEENYTPDGYQAPLPA